jgi:hypothetical protein
LLLSKKNLLEILASGDAMNSDKLRNAASRLYVDVEIGLWATLLAFVLYFAAVVAPDIPKAQAHADRVRAEEIVREHAQYCKRFDMPEGHPRHAQCVLDLGAFRAEVEKRFADDIEPF